MAWSAVSSAVTTIGELLTEEAIHLWGVEEQVERLQTVLKWMQSFLKEADAKQSKDERIRLWVAEIRELGYDAEDVVEDFALKVGSRRKGGFSNCIKRSACILEEAWSLHETRSKIEKIIARITDLVLLLRACGIKELRDTEGPSSSTERRESRRPYPHIIDDNIVGFDADINNLVSVLVDDQESEGRVVSICGMGGLGKTTLAKKIYLHSKVIGHFDRLAWVYVSQQFQNRKVWEEILSALKIFEKDDKNKRDEELAEKLFNFLKDKKCLLILDDVWHIKDWNSLKPAFPAARDSRSKILLTSRNKEIVSHADRRGYLHDLQCLDDKESWELFQKIAFPQTGSTEYRVDTRREELGKNMVKHCAGLPLAIIVLGGILVTKNSLNEWKMVFENVKSYFKRGDGQEIEDVLSLSYDDLPPYLRPCFLYFSQFPEDYEIKAHKLIQLWVAEGIASSEQEEGNGGEIAEDMAERYLIELVERCMIQVRERDVATLKIKTLQMHDLMRDLCLSKAKEENFLFIVDQPNAGSLSTIRKVRRVSVQNFIRPECIKNPSLRSLFFFYGIFSFSEILTESVHLKMMNYLDNHEGERRNPLVWIVGLLFFAVAFHKLQGIWTSIVNNFKLLRVLDCEGISGFAGGKLPCDIGNLIHLRFLSLRGLLFEWSKLPSSLGNLRCLQTLDLRVEDGSESIHVPNVLGRMEQLRHLYLPEKYRCRTKLKLGTLRNLQTLVNFNTQSCYVIDLSNMTNLRELEIHGPFHIEDFNKENLAKNPIIKSKYLHSLSIVNPKAIDPRHLAYLLSSCVSICRLNLNVEIRNLPEYHSKLPEYHYLSSSIAYIKLKRCKLREDPMPTLEKLRNLRILELNAEAFTGKEMLCSAKHFTKLESLNLTWLCNLEEWKVDEEAMPCLRQLEIQYCTRLKMLPDGLRFITTLQELKILFMPKAFKDKMVEGGVDFYKVEHVPSITIQNCDA